MTLDEQHHHPNYVMLPEKYFSDETPDINLFHFFDVTEPKKHMGKYT